MNKERDCKGCRLNESACTYVVYKITDKCPCMNCLVKIMCNNEFCVIRFKILKENLEQYNDRGTRY